MKLNTHTQPSLMKLNEIFRTFLQPSLIEIEYEYLKKNKHPSRMKLNSKIQLFKNDEIRCEYSRMQAVKFDNLNVSFPFFSIPSAKSDKIKCKLNLLESSSNQF